jgi:flagellar export protein FliJ
LHAEQNRALAARRLEEGEAERTACENALMRAREGHSSGPDQMVFLQALSFHQDNCQRLALALQSAAGEAAARRDVWLQARRKHEALVRLRDRQRVAHLSAAAKHEEAEIADLIGSRHVLRGAAAA